MARAELEYFRLHAEELAGELEALRRQYDDARGALAAAEEEAELREARAADEAAEADNLKKELEVRWDGRRG